MKRLLLLVATSVLALAPLTQAQTAPERYSVVRIYLPVGDDPVSDDLARASRTLLALLAPYGIGLDHVQREETARGFALRAVLSERDLAAAREAGANVEVVVEDRTAHYLATRQGTCQQGRSVSRISADLCGTMGGFPTNDGVIALLDTLRARHPTVVGERVSLGASLEGREIWMVEVSDNPGVDEGEPEVLYTSLHHAREPGGMMAVLYFMYYLAERYGSDSDVTALVDGRRLFFVPVVNPDGYAYNEEVAPEGGGLWRKNRRDNSDGWFGVDLNRNYGYEWGHDDLGSSPFTFSEIYRGPGPFSEPESQAIRDFMLGREIAAALNYHTPGRLLLYPWGYTDEPSPDSATYVPLADTLTYHNGYVAGQVPEVLYFANGSHDDWMYGEQDAKPKALALAPEAGTAFWPDPADLYAIADENLEANLLLAQLAEPAPPVTSERPSRPGNLSLELTGPNPTSGPIGISFSLLSASDASLVLYDVAGREVAVIAKGTMPIGEHQTVLDARRLAPGTYVVRLQARGEWATRRFTVVR